MDASSPRWTPVSDSPHDQDREALAFVRRPLYDLDPYRVWANFAFTTPSGALHEVDALAIADKGVHLIEITPYPGEICGNGATWRCVTPEGATKTFDNARIPGNRKGRALKAVLPRSKASANHRGDIAHEVVFLSDAHLRATLSPAACHQVFGSDPTDDAAVLAADLTDVELREAMSPDDLELDAEA